MDSTGFVDSSLRQDAVVSAVSSFILPRLYLQRQRTGWFVVWNWRESEQKAAY